MEITIFLLANVSYLRKSRIRELGTSLEDRLPRDCHKGPMKIVLRLLRAYYQRRGLVQELRTKVESLAGWQ